jgi:hypothetical protein
MNLVQNNPYRIVGLLVGATAKEQTKQISRLLKYIEAEQEPNDDFSFPILGKFNRTLDKVNEAASKLNLDNDKISAALFWFYIGNSITDEPAFDALKEDDINSAVDIWKKLVYDSNSNLINPVTKKNASAFNNLSTIYLLQKNNFKEAIKLKILFLESNFYIDLKKIATDETYNGTKKEIQLIFLNSIVTLAFLSQNELIDTILSFEFVAKNDFISDYVDRPIEQIETYIKDCKNIRKTHKEQVINAGDNLYNLSLPLLNQIKKMLGSNNLKFSSISDKVADEVLQCGIQLFNDYKEHETYDPGEPAMQLFQKAKTIAIGTITKQRCQENTSNLQEWIDEKPERVKQKKIHSDIEFITLKLERFQNLAESVINARDLIESCKPKLQNIKNIFGEKDEFYLKVSTAVVSNAQGMLISIVNKEQDKFKNVSTLFAGHPNSLVTDTLNNLSKVVNSAFDVTTTMQSMDMTLSVKQSFNKNREALQSIKNQIDIAKNRITSAPTGGTNGRRSEGCYIATMAYGDYNHPQVMILRRFRDDVLGNSIMGKMFIKSYYHYSPKLVEILKNQRTVNHIIRISLNQFIKLIK